MRKRTGDWRDLLSAYALALDAKKIYVGFIATLVTVLIMAVAAFVYRGLNDLGLFPYSSRLNRPALAELGGDYGSTVLSHFVLGTGGQALSAFLPLLNPFRGGLAHFVLSALVYVALFWAWSGAGGIVSRLAALEYARDELPTLGEARAMVSSRRRAYFFAPLMPFIVIVFLTGLNTLGGLIASIPWVGRILLIVPGFLLLVISTAVIVFLIVFGILSFGLMMPAVSVGGKDAFESWSAAYSYVLWGLRRFICYTLLAGVIGVVAAVVARGLTELVIYCIHQTVNFGFVSGTPWIEYTRDQVQGPFAVALSPASRGFYAVVSGVMVALLVALRALPAAYVFSYFFTANTIILFLMRKDQDNIEVTELYEEAPEEEEGEGVTGPRAEPTAEEKGGPPAEGEGSPGEHEAGEGASEGSG